MSGTRSKVFIVIFQENQNPQTLILVRLSQKTAKQKQTNSEIAASVSNVN